MAVVFASMAVLSVIRWRENAPLFVIGCFASAAALAGYLMRRHRPSLYIAGMGASYIALLSGFYLDNGPHLPLWERLPAWSHPLPPILVGVPLIARAIRRRRPARTMGGGDVVIRRLIDVTEPDRAGHGRWQGGAR